MDADAMHQAGLAAAAALPPDPSEGATPAVATPEGAQTEQGATTEDTQPFTKLDPNALPPEVRPYYESMQSDYTRKTQEAAPFRSLAEETGLDVEGLRQAAELYQTLKDPTALVQFHGELSKALQENGLTPAQAEAAATAHIVENQGGGEDLSLDPEERRIQDLEAKLARFEQGQADQAEQARQAQMQAALVSEMNRMEGVVREQYPTFDQDDIDLAYELSPFYGYNLIDAANRLDATVNARVTRILGGKGSVASNPAHAPLPPATAAVTAGQDFGDNLEAAHKAAMAYVKNLPQ
jgi:hypothetical protein